MRLHPVADENLLEGTWNMVVTHESAQRIILHELLHIALQEFVAHQIFVCHLVMVIIQEEQAQHLVHLPVAEEEVLLFLTILAQLAIDRMSVDSLLIAQQRHHLVRPVAIEERLLQSAEQLGCYLVITVDDFALYNPAGQSGTLAIIRYRLLRLEHISFGIIHHTQTEEDFCSRYRRNHIAGKGREQALASILIELEKAVGKHTFLAQGKIHTRNTERCGCRLLLCLLNDLIPLFGANQEIIIYQVVGHFIKRCLDTKP